MKQKQHVKTQPNAVERKTDERVVNGPAVDFDPKHVDSPLCACRACNDAWLARRDQPVSKKHVYEAKRTVDPAKHLLYKNAFVKYGLQLTLHENTMTRLTHWRLTNANEGFSLTTGFDVDLDRVLAQLEKGTPLLQLDLSFHAAPSVAKSTSYSTDPLTGGPFCVMCGEPGGLPSPNMVGGAKLLGLRLHFPEGDARLSPARLHPGHCRKRLRKLLDTAGGKTT